MVQLVRYLNGSLDSFLDCAYEFAKFISEVNEKYREDATLKEVYNDN